VEKTGVEECAECQDKPDFPIQTARQSAKTPTMIDFLIADSITTVPHSNIEAFMWLLLIPSLAEPRILLRVNRGRCKTSSRTHQIFSAQTPANELNSQKDKPKSRTWNRQGALAAEKMSYAFILFVIKAFAWRKGPI
jgi:hypothetical protein